MRYTILILLFIWVAPNLTAQNDASKSQLASQYYNDKEYEKAAVLYYELFEEKNAKVYFDYYVRCMVELEQYQDALKEVKKQYRRNKSELSYLVDLGYLSKLMGDADKAADYYEEAIDGIDRDHNQVIRLANSFLSRQEYEYAEKTYMVARERILGKKFHYELANVFLFQRNYEKLVNEYLDLLREQPSEIENVQSRLQYYLVDNNNEDMRDLLKTGLLKRLQSFLIDPVYHEMLIWLFVQEKDFESALIQAEALDKRQGTHDDKIINLAEMALSNQQYDVAENAYKYLVKKKSNLSYRPASLGLLTVYYEKVKKGLMNQPDDIEDLEKRYLSTMKEFGLRTETIQLIIDLAHLQAFYLNKSDAALDMLESALTIPTLPNEQKAQVELEMADIQLLTGDIWESALTYGRVERFNEHNPLGHEAKFRKAKLAYYSGNFKWAQAQLDALKASTSKLIANDACNLSLLIGDNLLSDTVSLALQQFARADMAAMQQRDNLALQTLDSLFNNFATHSLTDEAYFLQGKIHKRNNRVAEAAVSWQKIVDEHAWDILADDAMFLLAQLYEFDLQKPELAQELYKRILLEHADSVFAVEARKRFRLLRGDI